MPRRKHGSHVRIVIQRCCHKATESPKIKLFGLSVSILLAVVKLAELTIQLVSAAT